MKAYCGGSIACPMDRGPQIFLYAKAERDTQRKREKERGASEERGTFSVHTRQHEIASEVCPSLHGAFPPPPCPTKFIVAVAAR